MKLKQKLSYAVDGYDVRHYDKGTPASELHDQARAYAEKNDLLEAGEAETKDKQKNRK